MAINIPLLRKMVEWVEEQEALQPSQREWYQGAWLSVSGKWTNEQLDWCGTRCCVAGKIALLEGWEPAWDHPEARPIWTDYVKKDGEVRHVEAVAYEALGLDQLGELYEYEIALFEGENNAAMVRAEAEALAGERL